MSFNIYTPLTKLNPSKIKWCIRVRAQAIWKGITRDTKEFRGINILFFDDSNARIHVFINAKIAGLFEDNLQQGQIYKIQNFVVHKHTGYESHRCVTNDQHIYLADYTKLEKLSNTLPTIPEYAFDFFDTEELLNMQSKSRFLYDVIGVFKDKEVIREYINDDHEPKTQLKFSITDGRSTTRVTFFDDLAKSFDKAVSEESSQPIIIIISCAKIGTFQGELNLTNYPATRFYININHYSVKELRKRALQTSFYENQLAHKPAPNYDIMTLAAIKNLDDHFVEDKVRCQVTVNKVEDELQWFYHGCTNCPEELFMVDGRYKCNKCNRYIPYPERRFRICCLCSDSTAVIAIVLEDREVRRITGKTVFAVLLDEAELDDEVRFPTILKALVGKKYTITLRIIPSKLGKQCDVYDACEIVQVVEDFAGSTPLHELSGESEDSSHAVLTVQAPAAVSVVSSSGGPITANSSTKVRKMDAKQENIDDEHITLSKMQNLKKRK